MAPPKPTTTAGNKAAPSAGAAARGKGAAAGGPRGSAKSKAKDAAAPAERVVAENRRARHDYEIIDTLECGIALVGSEV